MMTAVRRESAAIERWLRDEVLPTIKALDADPSLAIPADEARRRIWRAMDLQSRAHEQAADAK